MWRVAATGTAVLIAAVAAALLAGGVDLDQGDPPAGASSVDRHQGIEDERTPFISADLTEQRRHQAQERAQNADTVRTRNSALRESVEAPL